MDGTHTVSTTSNLIVREGPPADDCCPICFGSFSVPCRGPCGHWYCGGCIMEYWNHVAAFHPCKCPMCSRPISKLTPESTLSQQQDPGIREVLRNVKQYNCLFAGGACGFILSADVWSCGVALYVMLVGAYPFEDQEDPKNFRKTIQRIMAVQYKIPDYVHISQDCRHLLSRIFVSNASRRISLKEIKSHPWFLKNLPRELTEAAQAAYYRKENPTFSPQSVEEIMKIVEDAKTPPTASRSIGGFGWGQEDDDDDDNGEAEPDDDEDEYDKRVKEAHQSGEVCLT